MEESTKPSLRSDFIGFKKMKNILASRFTDQQNIAHSSFNNHKNSIQAPSTSVTVVNRNLIVTDPINCNTFNEFNIQNERANDQPSIFHFDVVKSQSINRDSNNQFIDENIQSKSQSVANNQLNFCVPLTLNVEEANTLESHVVYQFPAVDDRTKILDEIRKIQQSLQILLDAQINLSEAQKQLEIAQDKVRNELKNIKNQNMIYETRDLLEENGIDLPIKSMEIFDKYCKLLEESSECRQILKTSIHYTVNKKKSLTKNISTMLRKYLSSELGSQFTAVKVVKKKTILAKTSFYKHMLNCFLERSASGTIGKLSEQEFNKALGEVLWNAKDWNKKKPS